MQDNINEGYPVATGGQVVGNKADIMLINKYSQRLTAFTIIVEYQTRPSQIFTVDGRTRGSEVLEPGGWWAKSMGSNFYAATKITVAALVYANGKTFGNPQAVAELISGRKAWINVLDVSIGKLKGSASDASIPAISKALLANGYKNSPNPTFAQMANNSAYDFVGNVLKQPGVKITDAIDAMQVRRIAIATDPVMVADSSSHTITSPEVARYLVILNNTKTVKSPAKNLLSGKPTAFVSHDPYLPTRAGGSNGFHWFFVKPDDAYPYMSIDDGLGGRINCDYMGYKDGVGSIWDLGNTHNANARYIAVRSENGLMQSHQLEALPVDMKNTVVGQRQPELTPGDVVPGGPGLMTSDYKFEKTNNGDVILKCKIDFIEKKFKVFRQSGADDTQTQALIRFYKTMDMISGKSLVGSGPQFAVNLNDNDEFLELNMTGSGITDFKTQHRKDIEVTKLYYETHPMPPGIKK